MHKFETLILNNILTKFLWVYLTHVHVSANESLSWKEKLGIGDPFAFTLLLNAVKMRLDHLRKWFDKLDHNPTSKCLVEQYLNLYFHVIKHDPIIIQSQKTHFNVCKKATHSAYRM